jgi:16S rRNA (cytosine967-C5)-methyltransferase
VTPQMLDEIVTLQETILKESARCLKPGGILVYSTCTLNRKENEGQVRKFLAAEPDYELLEERTLFPFEEYSDGFYFAKIIRKA